MEKMLPQNVEAERGVLGSIIIDPEAVLQVGDFLRPADFYRDAHRAIFEVIIALFNAHESADFITICDELERRGKLDDVGGASYITGLINHVPTSGNVEHYGRIVERTAILRRLIWAAGQIAAIAYEEGDADTALMKANQLVLDIGLRCSAKGPEHIDLILDRVMANLDYAHEHRGTILGVPTGFDDLDTLTNGLQKKEVTILAARPGLGKSSLGVCMAYNAAKRGNKVIIFSLEMGSEALGLKLVSMLSKVDTVRLRNGYIEDHEWERIIAARMELASLPLWIDDTTGSPLVSMQMKLQRMASEGNMPDLIVVDYLSLIGTPETEGKRYENRVQEVSAISRGLLALARTFDRPVLALAQLNRENEKRSNKRPQLSDLRESGTIEQDASNVWFIYREDHYARQEGRQNYTPTHIAELIVAKFRMGPQETFSLYFQEETTRFFPLSVMGIAPPPPHVARPYADDFEEEREVD